LQAGFDPKRQRRKRVPFPRQTVRRACRPYKGKRRLTMSKPTHNIIYKARSYQGEDGQTKHAYGTIGAAWSDDQGQISRIQLDSIPIRWDGALYLRQREEAAS
jgi:hypothetical protein